MLEGMNPTRKCDVQCYTVSKMEKEMHIVKWVDWDAQFRLCGTSSSRICVVCSSKSIAKQLSKQAERILGPDRVFHVVGGSDRDDAAITNAFKDIDAALEDKLVWIFTNSVSVGIDPTIRFRKQFAITSRMGGSIMELLQGLGRVVDLILSSGQTRRGLWTRLRTWLWCRSGTRQTIPNDRTTGWFRRTSSGTSYRTTSQCPAWFFSRARNQRQEPLLLFRVRGRNLGRQLRRAHVLTRLRFLQRRDQIALQALLQLLARDSQSLQTRLLVEDRLRQSALLLRVAAFCAFLRRKSR